jgi:hypothetical protein
MPAGSAPTKVSCTIDKSDFYNPTGIGVEAGDTPVDPEPPGFLTITNSIFQCNQAVNLSAAGPVARTADIHHNDLFSTLTPAIANPGVWTLTELDNLNVNPGYTAPTQCGTEGYVYSNQALTTAGMGGSPLGSQGETSGIETWSLY